MRVASHLTLSRDAGAPVAQIARAAFWVVLSGHLLAIAAGLAVNEMLAAVATASTVMLLTVSLAAARRVLLSFALPIVFVTTNVITFAYLNAAYLRFTALPTGVHHELTAWLAALIAGGAALGAAGCHLLLGRDALPQTTTPVVERWQTLAVTGAVFVLIAAGGVATGWLDARWELAPAEDFGLGYVVRGLGNIGYMVFFIAGTRLSGRLFAPGNLVILGAAGSLIIVQGFAGGRAASVIMALLLLAGAGWGKLGRRQLLVLSVSTIVLGILFAMVVGEARTREGFAFGSIESRSRVLQQAAVEVGRPADDRDPVEALVSRLFEFSGQVVIDQTVLTRHFAGFEDFDRLRHLFLPKFLVPDKLPISNGPEILVREFGYQLTVHTSVPITLIGDAFRRGGEIWVLAVGVLAGIALRLLSRLTLLVMRRDLAVPCLILFVPMTLGAYDESVLGMINLVTYQWAKQIVLFGVIAVAIRVLIALTTRDREPTTFEALPARHLPPGA